jgi:hypothetical protein
VNVQPLKPPSVGPESAVEQALGEPIVPPALMVKVIDTLGVKPLPDAVTVTPVRPWVGVRTSAGVVTVNGTEAEVSPVAKSVPVTPYVVSATDGTVNVQTKIPFSSVVMVEPLKEPSEHALGVWTPTPMFHETCAPDEALNPDPPTVYVAPAGPWSGVRVNVGVVTRNDTVAVLPDVRSVPTMKTVPSGVPAGTAKLHTKIPTESVVIVDPENVPVEHALGVCKEPAKVTVAPAFGVKPEPPTE